MASIVTEDIPQVKRKTFRNHSDLVKYVAMPRPPLTDLETPMGVSRLKDIPYQRIYEALESKELKPIVLSGGTKLLRISKVESWNKARPKKP